jgi:ADP-ribose pyrophosphatase
MSAVSPNTARPLSKQPRPPFARHVFTGKLFQVWQWEQELFDGSRTTFECLSRPDTVLVLPVLPNGDVVLGIERQPGMEPVLQALGGRIEEGESPLEAAQRELSEEGGFVANDWTLWDAWQPVTKIDWAVYLFVAKGLTQSSGRQLDGGERITLRHIPATQLVERSVDLNIGDYELLHKLYYARASEDERRRIEVLLGIMS